MKKLLCCLFLVLLYSVAPTWAAGPFYIATTGSDSNTGAIGSPFATIAKAFTVVTPAAGETIYMRTGSYNQQITGNSAVPVGTSWTNATTLSAYPGEVVTLYSSGGTRVFNFIGSQGTVDAYFIVSGFIIDAGQGTRDENGIKIEAGAHHIRIQDSEIINAAGQGVLVTGGTATHHNQFIRLNIHANGTESGQDHGIYLAGADNILEDSDVHHNLFGFGIHQFDNGTFTSHRNIIRYNTSHHNFSNGLLIGSGIGNQAYSNIVYENGGRGIQVGFQGTSGSQVYNNTVYNNGTTGILIKSDAVGTIVKNNLFYKSTDGDVAIQDDRTDTVKSNNRCDDSSAGCTNTANPGFVDAANENFSLLSTSVAIDAGTTSIDRACNGACDQGAHETFTCTGAGNTGLVPVGAPNTLVISCTQNVTAFYPLLPATGCGTGFTVRKAEAANAVTSCAISGNTITLTLTNSYSAGNSADWYYDASLGGISNSALMGNVTGQNQRLNNVGTVGTPIIAVNQAGGSTPTLTQVAFQFRSVGGTETAPNSVSVLNTNVVRPPGKCSVVRGQISNTVADVGDTTSFALYAQKNGSGGFTQIINGPCTSTGICFVKDTGNVPPELVAGTATTEQLAGSGTFVAGGVQFDFSETPDVLLTNGKDTELVAVVCTGSANANDAYFDLRWEKSGGTDLTTYTQIPRITISDTGYKLRVGAL